MTPALAAKAPTQPEITTVLGGPSFDLTAWDFPAGCEARRCDEPAELLVTVKVCCGAVGRLSCASHFEHTRAAADRFWTCHRCGRIRWVARTDLVVAPIGELR